MIDELSGDFLQQLRGFYYVAQLGSMGQAAKVMHRSQSSVSRLIKQLEISLSTELFSRIQKGVVLTNEGEELFKQAVDIFEKIRSIHSELGHAEKEPAGAVNMRSSQLAFVSFIAPILSDLHKKYPALDLHIADGMRLDLMQKKLEDRSLDFAVVVGGDVSETFEFIPLFSTPMVLAVPHGAAKNIHNPSKFEDLPDLPFIRMPGGSGFTSFLEGHMPKLFSDKVKSLIVSSIQFQLHMTAAGMGFTIVPEVALKLLPTMPITVFSLEHLFPAQTYGMVYLRNGYIRPQAKAVINFLKEHSSL